MLRKVAIVLAVVFLTLFCCEALGAIRVREGSSVLTLMAGIEFMSFAILWTLHPLGAHRLRLKVHQRGKSDVGTPGGR